MSSEHLNQCKKLLRQRLLAQRQTLSPIQWRQKSDRLCHALKVSGVLTAQPWGSTLLAYFSTKREPDLSPLFDSASGEWRWGFPRCEGKTLQWHAWSSGAALENNRYGIPEPRPNVPKIEAIEVGLILVPAIACDLRGYRLGYGGGYYDRLLGQPAWAQIPTVGIVFAEGLLPQVPVAPWDKPLDMVCTDEGLHCAKGRSHFH
ncbi:MAG: 5-formyltetrahydrofolate cyclo-ligase [Elainellaceae cyanobacterium]